MKVWISDNANQISTVLEITEEPQVLCLEGQLPEGLALQDFLRLALVNYESGVRGRPIPRLCRVSAEESLDYVRALQHAMPPGYHVCKVESEEIERQREEKAALFEEELRLLSDMSEEVDSP